MSSSERPAGPFAPYRTLLLDTARSSIREGLRRGRPLRPTLDDAPPRLVEPGASFVTLQRGGRLRGCIGTLEPHQPLLTDVAANAYAAAFRDPRFPPLGEDELDDLHLHLSILHPPEPLECASEAELRRCLRPGVDGLILEADGRRATFLPSVWESLPDPAAFVHQLKLKAGLPADYWSDGVRLWRYTTESIEDR